MLTLSAALLAGLVASFNLPDLPYSVSRGYLQVRNGLWGAMGLATGIGLLRGAAWARWSARWGGPALALWYWGDRLFFAQSGYARLRQPFDAAVTLLSLALIHWALSRPTARHFFQENA